MGRALFGAALGLALASAPRVASAHLLDDDTMTVRVQGSEAFVAMSIPLRALGGDDVTSEADLSRHAETLRAAVARGVELEGGRVDDVGLWLSTSHALPQRQADHVLALVHVAFDHRPERVDLRLPLLRERGAPAALDVRVTVAPDPLAGPAAIPERASAKLTASSPSLSLGPIQPRGGADPSAGRALGLACAAVVFFGASALLTRRRGVGR